MPISKKITLPKTLGACADRLYKLRQLKSEQKQKLDALDAEYKAIKEKLIQELPKSKAEGVTGRAATATIRLKDIPSVKDWDQLYKYIKRTGDFSLLQRRVSDGAVKERWEDRKKVPGVEPFRVVDVSVTKKR